MFTFRDGWIEREGKKGEEMRRIGVFAGGVKPDN